MRPRTLALLVVTLVALTARPAEAASLRDVYYTTHWGQPVHTIVRARSDGTHRQTLFDGQAPAISPDGTELAYTTVGGNLTVVDVDGQHPLLLAEDAAQPAWSHDGTHIVFQQIVDETGSGGLRHFQLFTVAATGIGGPTRITSDGDNDLDPAYSPDDSMVAFTQQSPTDGSSGVAIRDSSGTVTTFEMGTSQPTWCGSGGGGRTGVGHLIFVKPGPHGGDLYVSTFAGDKRLTDSAHHEPAVAPSCSADGSSLVYTRPGAKDHVYIAKWDDAGERLTNPAKVSGKTYADEGSAGPVL